MTDAPLACDNDPLLELRDAYVQARADGATRRRDIAAQLGVSEGELIAAHAAPGHALRARRLRAEWPQVIAALQGVGEVMALTRNASCVHEKTGPYQQVSASGHAGGEIGLALGEQIDLRLFYRQWAHGFAVQESTARGEQRSLLFFDATGMALHKVFTKAGTDLEAWAALVDRFASPHTSPGIAVRAAEQRKPESPDTQIDVPAFRQAWSAMRDTHEFFGLLKTHGVTRTQALRLAEPAFAQAVDAGAARELLHSAAASGTPIMCFVGNPGVIQIHSGPVKRVEVIGPWLNVLDPHFNLHLREDHIAQAWAVRKPTSDGIVTSLELFDAGGDTIAMFFGERKPGRPERCSWRQLVDRLVSDARWLPIEAGCNAC